MPDQRHDRGPSYGALTCRCGRMFASTRALAAHVGHYAPRGTHHGTPVPRPRRNHYVAELGRWCPLTETVEFYRGAKSEEWVLEWLRGGREMAAPNGAQGALL